MGHQLPRRAVAGAAAPPPTPDTKADGRRGGSGPERKHPTPNQGSIHDRVAVLSPAPTHDIHSTAQPYFKLHGSSNWTSETGRILIMGGNKESNISRYPTLSWYHSEFRKRLAQPNVRLMIIGYSFGDKHINDIIENAIDRNRIQLFIIDPKGVDVLDKRDPHQQIPGHPDPFRDKLNPYIIGASRRSLRSIFGNDIVEFSKVMKFFA